MHGDTRFLPGFHHRLFGRKPVGSGTRLARKARQADALCLTQLHTLFEDVLPSWLATFKTARGANSRRCTYTTLVTFWAFLSQVLDPDGSCRRALTRVQTLCSALGLALPKEDTGAYCIARSRLPIRVLFKVFYCIVARLAALPREGRRIVVMDGTSIRMPDTPENAAAYSYTPGAKPGCGFPLMQLLGLFDLSTGVWLATIKSKVKAHDARLAWKMLKHLRTGDILLADRAFCSYAFIVACQRRGVDVVMRLHQARDPQTDKGRRIGPNDWQVTWSRPAQCIKGQHPAQHAALPAVLPLRLVQVQSNARGHRTHELKIVTTLRDPAAHHALQIAAWYQRRWQVELCFDDIKTSLRMDVLRCKSPHMVARELLMHMIAYNLVRHLIISAGPWRAIDARDGLSFKGTMDRLDQWQWAIWSAPNARHARRRRDDLLQTIANDPIIKRPGRKEPRVCKDRQNKYTLMTKPRHCYGSTDDLAHAA
jgi:hypothetical protein